MAVTSKILVDRQTSSMRPHLRLFKAVRVRAPRTLDNVTITMKPTTIAFAMHIICNKMADSHMFNLLSKPKFRMQDRIRDMRTAPYLINSLLFGLHRAVTSVSTCPTVRDNMRLTTSEQEFLARLHESMRITSTGRDRRYRLQTEQNNNVTDSLNREHKTPEKRAGNTFATKRPRHNTMSVLCLPRHSTSHNPFSITNVQAITRGHWEQSQPLRPILVPNGLLSQQVS